MNRLTNPSCCVPLHAKGMLQPNSAAFIKKYGLKGSNGINTALKTLMNKEYVFKSDKGYCIYDRFMKLWLQTLPYAK